MTVPARVWHCGDEAEHAAHAWDHPERGAFYCVGTTAEGAEIARRARFAGLPRYDPPAPIEWGSTMCSRRRCVELAVCALDGEPYCLVCVDEVIERAAVPPELARLLPSLDE